MSSRSNRALWSIIGSGVVLAAALWRPAGAAPALTACVDKASPTASYDVAVVKAAAKAAGQSTRVSYFDGAAGDDDGFPLKRFRRLVAGRCDLVMGFPVERADPVVPAGMEHTSAYLQTGFVLAARQRQPRSVDELPAQTLVAVTYNSPSNLFFVNDKAITTVVYDTEQQSLAALIAGKVAYAVLWQPSVASYARHHGTAAPLAYRAIHRPHADWALTALYSQRAAVPVKRFERGLEKIRADGTLKALTAKAGFAASAAGGQASATHQSTTGTAAKVAKVKNRFPALYAERQADRGARLYSQHCAVCHGAQLQGVVGPTLKGTAFAEPDDGFTVGGMFTFLSTEMPAGQPGSLKKDEYAAVMAFLLRENGYRPGADELTYAKALRSSTPLVAHRPQSPRTEIALER